MIVFVCGLSKSGKSSLIESARKSFPSFQHLRASRLLHKAGRPTSQISSSEVTENQRVLVDLVKQELASGAHDVILDGHFLIETIEGPMVLPRECLDRLPLHAVFMVIADPAEIEKRRFGSSAQISSVEAASRIEMECIHAQRLAAHRGVTFAKIQSGNVADFTAKLQQVTTRSTEV
jgi:adenylate kinase